jgi:hypothetical protein
MAQATTPDDIRDKLAAALSAAGAAVTGMAELLRDDERLNGVISHAAAFDLNPGGDLLPLGEEVIEPLIDALVLAIDAGGLVRPLHRISAALERFRLGDDD